MRAAPRQVTDSLWPVRPKLEPGELLSSWLTRTARANGVRPSLFCYSLWKSAPVWNRDIDWLVPPYVFGALMTQAGVDMAVAEETTLRSLIGKVFAESRLNIKLPWVLLTGIYHRTRFGYGQQYCPRCLATDERPYFRRSWRLGFVTACLAHGIRLRDRCPHCRAGLCPHRVDIEDLSLRFCYACRGDLSDIKAGLSSPVGLAFQAHLEEVAKLGFATVRNCRSLNGPAYFLMVRHIVRILAGERIGPQLRQEAELGTEFQVPAPEVREHTAEVEFLSTADRHQLLSAAAELMHPWPDRFTGACKKYDFRSSDILRDHESALPYRFCGPLIDATFKGSYTPSQAEIENARAWLKANGAPSDKRSAKRFISTDSQVARQ